MLKNQIKNRFNSGKKVSTLELQIRAEELGVDPFEVLLLFAKGDGEALGLPVDPSTGRNVSPNQKLQFAAAAEACKYMFPQLKSTEMSGPEGGPMEVRSSLAQQLVDMALEEARKRDS